MKSARLKNFSAQLKLLIGRRNSCPLSGVACAVLAMTTAPSVAEPGVTPEKIVFGQAASLKGPAAILGSEMRTGLLAAFAETNRAGGVKGRKLELISRDDGYEPDKSIEATNALIDQDNVFALVGAVGTPTSLATQPIAAAHGVPFIGAFTGAEFLREPYKKNVINVRASYYQETEEMIERITRDLGTSRIAILYQDDAFGRAGLAGVQRALDKRSLHLVAEGTFERNTTAVKHALLKIRAGNPQVVILVGAYIPCAVFIKLAKQLAMDALFMNISFVGSDALAKQLGPEGAGVIVTQVVPSPYDQATPLIARYQAAIKAIDQNASPSYVSLEGYIVGRLVSAALERVSNDPTREQFLDNFSNATFDFDGFTLAYSASDNRGSDKVFLTEIQSDGSLKTIASLKARPKLTKSLKNSSSRAAGNRQRMKSNG